MKFKLNISNRHLQMEIEEARKSLARNPHIWGSHERMGRIYYWMEDPSAVEYFRKAIEYYPIDRSIKKNRPLVKVGNLFRLAGEPDLAYNYFERAYIMLKQQAGDINKPEEIFFHRFPDLIAACFVLGKYDEAVVYSHLLQQEDPDPNLFAYNFVRLAEAKLDGDIIKAERLVDELAVKLTKALKLGTGKIQDTGSITSFDLYELAVEMVERMRSEES